MSARPTTSVGYGYRGSLVATGVAVVICIVGVIIVIVRRVTMSSTSVQKTLSKNISSVSPKSPLSKSTTTLAGGSGGLEGGGDDSSDIRNKEENEEAGFGSSNVTCAITNATINTPTGSEGYSKSRTPTIDEELQLSRTVVHISDSNLSEHHMMLPTRDRFYPRRASPEGRKDDRFGDITTAPDMSKQRRDPEGWLDLINEEMTTLPYKGILPSQKKYR